MYVMADSAKKEKRVDQKREREIEINKISYMSQKCTDIN